ncbi:MAG: PASTA domain-containing protein [Prolixibacteraceae bacterium]|jgi:beta-lactam-binding protein with PASTA domain|nr:PASTA domain-containing protein [Prolixibacteraceae bacterium]
MSLKAFFKSKALWINISLLVVFFALMVYFTLFLLKVYTNHGETISVPDLTGLGEREVEIVTREKNLKHSIIDSTFVPTTIPGTMISQQPEAGHKVKEGRTVYLTISATQPEKVTLPAVVDVSLREAQSRLENAGLKLGQIEYRPSEFINLVLDKKLNGTQLPNDTLLIKGTEVDLVVGKGLSNERTVVPDVKGMYMSDAYRSLYNLSLNTGALIYDQSVQTAEDSTQARVWKQMPEGDGENLIELGTSVDIWLTVDDEKIEVNTIDEDLIDIE